MTQDNTGKKFPYDATTLALAIKHTVEKYRLDEAKNAMDKEPVRRLGQNDQLSHLLGDDEPDLDQVVSQMTAYKRQKLA